MLNTNVNKYNIQKSINNYIHISSCLSTFAVYHKYPNTPNNI